jgi:hypothetical protein
MTADQASQLAATLSTLHQLLALLMVPRSAARRLLVELGVSYEEVVRHIEAEGARRVAAEDCRPRCTADRSHVLIVGS